MERWEKKITKKEINEKKDYLVVELSGPEKYCFDTNVVVERHKSIKEIIESYLYDEPLDMEKLERQGYHGMGYLYDNCRHGDYDLWCLSKKEQKRFEEFYVDTLLIVECTKLMQEDSFCTCWGDSHRKYGLLDYRYTPIEMDKMVHKFNYTKLGRLIDKIKWKIKSKRFKKAMKRLYENKNKS